LESDQTNPVAHELPQSGSFFEVKLEAFDGPIDLLLHLVKSNELAIERISLAAVTEQYLKCIEEMHDLDLDIAAEYLVVAATLLSIKAAVLLQDPLDLQAELEASLPDPHRELLERLRAAQVYKDGASVLGKKSLLGVHVFQRPSSLSEFESPEEVYRAHDAMLLGQAFRKLLDRVGKEGFLIRFEIDSVSVVERMVSILDELKLAGAPVEFSRLITDVKSRIAIVNSFIAILELAKRNAIVIVQDRNFDEIKIALSSSVIDKAELSSEFDGGATTANAPESNITVNG